MFSVFYEGFLIGVVALGTHAITGSYWKTVIAGAAVLVVQECADKIAAAIRSLKK